MADDEDLFKKAIQDVTPLQQDKKIIRPAHPKTGQNSAALRQHAEEGKKPDLNYLDLNSITPVNPEDIIGLKKNGVQEGVYKKLRQGKYPIEDQLDLHSSTVKEAQSQVLNYIKQSVMHNYRCVLITHGKGVQSKTPGKIKSHVNHWLQQIPDALAFHSAQAKDGGTGAVYVLLKKSEAKKQENREKYNR